MTGRQLPAHIAAALAGNTADSAGQPWAGRDLSGPDNPLHAFDDDDGSADERLAAAVAALLTTEQPGPGERAVVSALSRARVFIPIVASVSQDARASTGLHADKEAEMALVTLTGPDGRTALPVFSSTRALTAWHPDARPVAAYTARAALAAVADETSLLVLDPGAELTFVVRRPAVWALAQQRTWTPSYEDEELAGLVGEVVANEPEILSVELRPAAGVLARTVGGSIACGGGPGPELRMDLRLRDGLAPEQVRALVAGFRTRLLDRPEIVERTDSLDIKLTR